MNKPEEPSSDKILLGTSGWSYKEWEKVFYPDSRTPKLSYYSSIFQTAEIDSSFYAYPNRGLAIGWVRNTPPGFQFSAKIPKLITHDKRLDLEQGVEIDLGKFIDVLAPLKDAKKLGPLLIQLPPSFTFNEIGILGNFFEVLPKDHMFAVEFRHLSWLEDLQSVDSLLRKFHVSNTIVDEPLLPIDLKTTADFTFVRWHGKGKRVWYNYEYTSEELDPWIERVEKISKKVKRVYGYFNNHFHGSAVFNSLEMLEKLGLANKTQKETLDRMFKIRSGEMNADGQSTLV
ncbi:MAG TPA: DUF72 domain-containing protein [Nitrososphaerales archaeon]|nr:DUF72 domain-containing protein [Nitrososphaerales archaeon]